MLNYVNRDVLKTLLNFFILERRILKITINMLFKLNAHGETVIYTFYLFGQITIFGILQHNAICEGRRGEISAGIHTVHGL